MNNNAIILKYIFCMYIKACRIFIYKALQIDKSMHIYSDFADLFGLILSVKNDIL